MESFWGHWEVNAHESTNPANQFIINNDFMVAPLGSFTTAWTWKCETCLIAVIVFIIIIINWGHFSGRHETHTKSTRCISALRMGVINNINDHHIYAFKYTWRRARYVHQSTGNQQKTPSTPSTRAHHPAHVCNCGHVSVWECTWRVTYARTKSGLLGVRMSFAQNGNGTNVG